MKQFFIMLFTFFHLLANAQSLKIKGIVRDTADQPLPSAMILLLSARDSVMQTFFTTNSKGAFTLEAEKNKSYLVQVSFLGFETFWEAIKTVDISINLEEIRLVPITSDLPAIEVRGEYDMMKLSGDTVEYNTKAFKVQPGALVEDLLKKLPGLEVQRDGSVKAYGENVQNVLVDGKEFFGKDTRMATKNLDADAVDKVQVFDKKSDMAEFTGVDDGQEEKTINLKLKANRKNGYFGNAELAGGTSDRYKARFNINRFSPGNRLSVIGLGNNINEQSFSMDEYMNFMGGIGAFMSGGRGRIEISDNAGMFMGGGNTQGIQRSWAGGLNLNKTVSPKTDFNLSYLANDMKNTLDRNSERQSILTESFYNTKENENRVSGNTGHNINFRLKSKLDSSINLIWRGGLNLGNNNYNSRLANATFNASNALANQSNRLFDAFGNSFAVNTTLTLQKRFQKAGRSISLNSTLRMGNADRNGNINALNQYLTGISFTDTILQNQLFNDKNNQIDGRIAYTEPLGKRNFVELSGSASKNKNNTNTDYFDIIDQTTEIRNNLLSTAYNRGYSVYQAGLKLIKNREKYHLSYGANWQQSILNGMLNNAENPIKIKYDRLLPEANFQYDIKTGNHVNLNYYTNIQEPSLQQLQPTVNNSDPLNIYIGNPDLKHSYVHAFRGSYFLYDQFSFTSLFANIGATYTNNRITDLVDVDSLFRRTIRPVNVDYEKGLNGSIEFGTPIRPLKITTKIRLRSQLSQGILFVNELENTVNRASNSLLFSIENRRKEKWDVLAGIKLSKSNTHYSVQDNLDQKFSETNLFGELSFTPNAKWIFKSEYDDISYNQSGQSNTFRVPLWKASITRIFGKDQKFRGIFSAFDILDRNKGITRSSQLNYQEVLRTNALGRYCMLGLTYSIRGFKKTNGIEINFGNEKR